MNFACTTEIEYQRLNDVKKWPNICDAERMNEKSITQNRSHIGIDNRKDAFGKLSIE